VPLYKFVGHRRGGQQPGSSVSPTESGARRCAVAACAYWSSRRTSATEVAK